MIWDGVWIFIAILTAIVTWLRWNNNHWKKKGVPFNEPTLFFGNAKDSTIGNINYAVEGEKIYKDYPGEPIVGTFRLREPILMVKDIDLVKEILVTKFNCFRDNGMDVSKEADPIVGRNPFFLKAEAWRIQRKLHTHNHTANKLKILFGFVEEVKDEVVDHVNKNLDKKFDALDFCSRFTTDVVSSCVFGLKTRSHAGEDSDFRYHSNNLLKNSWRLMIWQIFPSLINLFKISLLERSGYHYIVGIVKELVEHRLKNNVYRADFLQNVISDMTPETTIEDVAGQAFTFFIDGYITSATEMSFILFMLAIHPEAQVKLRREVESVEKLDFETIHTLPYMEAVFQETTRLYPAGTVLRRVCNEATTLTIKNKPYEFNVGDCVEIPVYAIHRDPDNFPDPLKFDPQRFVEQPNHPAYLTFGIGPRACFGQRFAKTQIKTGIAHLVKNFQIVPGTDDHSIPTVNNNKSILIMPDKEMSIKFVKL